jgi:3-methyladenine DNA glycosylase AlkD
MHPLEDEVRSALAWLEGHSAKRTRDDMARYGILSDNAFGVTVANIKVLAKHRGRNHQFAAALWDTGWYEARMLTSFAAEPASLTPAQMDRWCRDFDNWGICDTVCFHLFDRTPPAWQKVAQWHARPEEFVKRAAFALLWGLTVHDKQATTSRSPRACLRRARSQRRTALRQEGREYGLRAIGKRNPALNAAAVTVARRLGDSPQAAPRWVGRDALRELTSAAVTLRLAGRRRATAGR